MQPLVQALPLTAVNNALRAIMNEGAGLAGVSMPLAILVAWGAGELRRGAQAVPLGVRTAAPRGD